MSTLLHAQAPNPFPSAYSVQRAMSKGREASAEFKNNFQVPENAGNSLISIGRAIEGVSQDFVLNGRTKSTVRIPLGLTQNIMKNDVFRLLEAQRLEHLLVDAINSAAIPSVSTRFHSQLLMTQRLYRAELEAKLYRCAIAKGGLSLLEDGEPAEAEDNGEAEDEDEDETEDEESDDADTGSD